MDFYDHFFQLLFYCPGIGSKPRLQWRRTLVQLILCSAFFISCNDHAHPARKIEPAFYHWKSIYNLSSYESSALDSLKVKKIYIKYFDVDWDAATRQPLPKAMIRFKQKALQQVIPTVFITNECIQQIDSSQLAGLGEKIVSSIRTINSNNGIDSLKEVQIDCDWSASTRDRYFQLLKNIDHELKNYHPQFLDRPFQPTATKLSVTIRLYQVKYKDRAGIPPVDIGMLMCYNMGNLKSIGSKNSIIETAELKKYIDQLDEYPLSLDIALPVFNWKVWFRDRKYYGITEEFPDQLLSSAVFTKDGNNYTVLTDTMLAGYELRKNDILRHEESLPSTVLDVAKLIGGRLKNTHATVALYHLDSVILSKYSLHELEAFYNSLR